MWPENSRNGWVEGMRYIDSPRNVKDPATRRGGSSRECLVLIPGRLHPAVSVSGILPFEAHSLAAGLNHLHSSHLQAARRDPHLL